MGSSRLTDHKKRLAVTQVDKMMAEESGVARRDEDNGVRKFEITDSGTAE